jgi:hypothetical protein
VAVRLDPPPALDDALDVARQAVELGAAVDAVGLAVLGVDHVFVAAAVEEVRPAAADQRVGPGAAGERVVARRGPRAG